MNADLIKRERIREALTARLLQLSRKCEEVCSPTPSSLCITGEAPIETKSNSRGYDIEVFKIKFPDQAQNVNSSPQLPSGHTKTFENMLIKNDTILPIMINNFVTPNLASHNLVEEKAFSRDFIDKSSIASNLSDSEKSAQPVDTQSECDSRLFITTPSTDLEHYMNTSDNSILTPSDQSPSTSDGTSISEPDHITVVSLTSDTESQDSLKLYEDYAQLQLPYDNTLSLTSNFTEMLPKVLNELPASDKISTDEKDSNENADMPNSRTPRRRRLSYTLDTPSPVLEKALKNSSVGPDAVKQKPVSKTTKENNNIHCQTKPIQSLNSSSSSAKETCVERPTSVKGCFSSRIPVMNSPKASISSVLMGYEQHVSALDQKNQSLRQYLDKLNSSVTPFSSPKHEPRSSSRTEYSNSPPLTPLASHSSSLATELQSLRDEVTQQRQLLVDQTEHLKDMARKQESFFQRMLSAQHQQMAQLQKELSREVHELFAQHSLAVQTRLQTLEASILSLEEDRHGGTTDNIPDERSTYAGSQIVDGLIENQDADQSHPKYTSRFQTSDTFDGDNIIQHSKVVSTYTNANFDRISAAVKGYLTRRLLKTEKVQGLIQTIRDTMECALNLHEISRNNVTKDDAELHQRLINQVTSGCHAFHDVFFKYTTAERMNLIAQSRLLAKEKSYQNTRRVSRPYISSATIKSLERKKSAKSKSVSPNAGRMKWKEPKRSSTAMEVQRKPDQSVQRKLLTTPVKDQPVRPKVKGDCRSPSFYS